MKIINAVRNKDDHNTLMEAAMSSSISAMEARFKKIESNPRQLDALLDLAFIAIYNINKEIKKYCIMKDRLWIQHISDYLCIPLNKDKYSDLPIIWKQNIIFIYRKYDIKLPSISEDYLNKYVIWPISKIIKKYYKNLGYKVKLKKKEWDDEFKCYWVNPSMTISWKG